MVAIALKIGLLRVRPCMLAKWGGLSEASVTWKTRRSSRDILRGMIHGARSRVAKGVRYK